MSSPECSGSARRGRNIRLLLLAISIPISLIALFYVEEDWRGKRAWAECRRRLEAQGAELDWAAYIPPPVPEEQNVLKAPKMAEWFQKNGPSSIQADAMRRRLQADLMSGFSYRPRTTNELLVADLTVVRSNAQIDRPQGDVLLQMADPNAPDQVGKLLQQSVGPIVGNVRGLTFMARSLDQIKPLRIVLATDLPTGITQLAGIFRTNALTPLVTSSSMISQLRARAASASNSYTIWLSPHPCAAADYLDLSKPAEADLNLVREALKRPYARMDGDYQRTINVPIPNFVTVRTVVQTIAERAQCYLLLNRPEDALKELTLIHDMQFLLLGKPPARQLTLVAAMIHVAINGLYDAVVADGLRLQAWQEPQLIVLQQQLAETDLLGAFCRSMESERAGSCRLLEQSQPGQLRELFSFGPVPNSFWTKIKVPRYFLLYLVPQGWMYQNMVTIAHMAGALLDGIDRTNRLVNPRKIEDIVSGNVMALGHLSPYNFMAAIAVPNFRRATQTASRNQALTSQALVACALERYRLAHHDYPETLAAIVPQYLDTIPADPVTGQPLKYRRGNNEHFTLYSVGWNTTDEGGVPGKTDTEGDWVWPQ